MRIRDMQEEILRLKKEKGICILAHSYQAREILEVADRTGDSFQLSVAAQSVPEKAVLVCGVRFMAETVKILSPEKEVFLSNPTAGCPMAEQMTPEQVLEYKAAHPDALVVAYVNTTAALKTVSDVCVTSSSAVKIVESLPQKEILFIPDCNLGQFVREAVPDKHIDLFPGGCPVHSAVPPEAVAKARAAHPEALLLVHPECVPAVAGQADFVGSTAAIMAFAKKSEAREFLIGTENSIAEHLQYDCPGKRFYPLDAHLICADMKATTLVDVYDMVSGYGAAGYAGHRIELDGETIRKARRCIDEMIRLG